MSELVDSQRKPCLLILLLSDKKGCWPNCAVILFSLTRILTCTYHCVCKCVCDIGSHYLKSPKSFSRYKRCGHFVRRQAMGSTDSVSHKDQDANDTDDACLVLVMSLWYMIAKLNIRFSTDIDG